MSSEKEKKSQATNEKQTKENALKKTGVSNDAKDLKRQERIKDTPLKDKNYDKSKREILDYTFENILRMSKNSLKLNYSKLKNYICCYKYINSRFEKDKEIFYKSKKTLFILKIGSNSLSLYCRLPENSLDKKKFPHRQLTNKEYNEI